MRVLHLPVNIASIPSHSVRALRAKGVDARGVVLQHSRNQSSEGLIPIDLGAHPRYSPAWIWTRAVVAQQILWKWIAWADILHWYYNASVLPFGFDLRLLKWIGKPGVVEWLGSDIRNPEVEAASNPVYARVFGEGYEYAAVESAQKSARVQKKFKDAGFSALVWPDMAQYVQPGIEMPCFQVRQRLLVDDYDPEYPDPFRSRPVVVHAPSARKAKGTEHVLAAVDALRAEFDFEFVLIENMPRMEAVRMLQRADIVLDQFVLGTFGMLSLEAMALGKPVLCYIKPALSGVHPAELPIVSADPDTLREQLGVLLADGVLRRHRGKAGRAYVEQYHNAAREADTLLRIYETVLGS